ncbi:hypothetical protein FDUTEX481_01653 [Tolypothrix sp. PCC 7601]|nr:hypothetical protein FDUTEX481_01653 [Tolypothrix sp. PCC 7601]
MRLQAKDIYLLNFQGAAIGINSSIANFQRQSLPHNNLISKSKYCFLQICFGFLKSCLCFLISVYSASQSKYCLLKSCFGFLISVYSASQSRYCFLKSCFGFLVSVYLASQSKYCFLKSYFG